MSAERKAAVREAYAAYPDHVLESVVRFNSLAVIGMPPSRNEHFGHGLALEVARELLAERRRP